MPRLMTSGRWLPTRSEIGPGFIAEGNVDVAIETLPGQEGVLVEYGPTAMPTGRSVPLGNAREERFVYAAHSGPWEAWAALGDRVEAGAVIGRLGANQVVAPISGRLRGMVRSTRHGVSRGSKLIEIDPRLGAPWTGVPPRAKRIAAGVQKVVDALLPVGQVRLGS
jgi:xanthine dehydrogenase accessory factor